MQYTVTNTYGITGESYHRSVVAALKERDNREGEGWVVEDDDGNQWDIYDGVPVITRYSHELA